ncbi:MAG: hypothetical protein JXB30_13160 [Anaerolineae bacterium]|nr:hypothetical protein [Anaerolineae bacterium]
MLTKILISILVVISLAEVSKRIDPVLGGILNGLPLGTGLTVYFIAYEKGAEYILPGIPWGIVALGGSLSFCLAYYTVGKIAKSLHRAAAIALASLSGIGAFVLFGLVFRQLPLDMLTASLLFISFYIANLLVFVYKIRIEVAVEGKKSSFTQIIFRGILVSGIIVTLTTLGGLLGSEWAAIFSSFPSTLFVLLVVLHYEEGSKMYIPVLYGFSMSIFVLFIFYWACAATFPLLDLNISFLIIYGVSIIFLIFFNKIVRAVQQKGMVQAHH